MNKFKISIIVPVYNGEKYLRKCVISIFEQTLSDIEFIFVDDYSKDNSIKILETAINNYPQLKPNIKIIQHHANKGIGAARNTGIDNAIGEYITFIDQDDYIDSDALEIFYSKAKETDADVVHSNYLLQFERSSKSSKETIFKDKEDFLINILSGKFHWTLWSRIYKRDFLAKYKIRIPEDISGCDDLAIVPIIYFHAKRISYVNFAPYHYVQYNPNSFSKEIRKEWINKVVLAFTHLENFFFNKDEKYRLALEKNKMMHKMYYLRNTRGTTQKSVLSLFPESDMDTYLKNRSKGSKCMYWLSKNQLFFIQNTLINLKDFLSLNN